MPTSPILVNAPDNTELMQTLGKAIGGYWRQHPVGGTQESKIAQGSVLGGAVSNLGQGGGAGTTQPQDSFRTQSTRDGGQQIGAGPSPRQDSSYPNVAPMKGDQSAESLKPLAPPPKLELPTYQQEQRRVDELIKQGVEPDRARQSVQDEIQTIKDRYTAEVLQHTSLENYRKEREAKRAAFNQTADQYIKDKYSVVNPSTGKTAIGIDQDEVNLWKQIALQGEGLDSDEERISKADMMFNSLVRNPLVAFNSEASGLPYFSKFQSGEVQDRLDTNKNLFQNQLKAIDARADVPEDIRSKMKGLIRNKAARTLAEKDWGTAQAAYVTSDLGDSFKKALPEVSKAMKGGKTLYGISEIPKTEQQKTEDVYKLANSLTKLQPTDSLVLARDYALSKNYTDSEFNKAMQLATQSGKLNLSEYQVGEQPLLAHPQRLDLNSIMEGKENIFDVLIHKAIKAKK